MSLIKPNTTRLNSLQWLVIETASEATIFVSGVSDFKSTNSVFRDKVTGQVIAYDAISSIPFQGGIKTKIGYIHPTNLLSVVTRDDDIPFLGIKAFALENEAHNILGYNDLSTDWSIWGHYNNGSYWASSQQQISQSMGAIFIGTPATLTTKLYSLALEKISATDYVASIYMKTDKIIEIITYATLDTIESEHKTITLSPHWQRIQFLFENNSVITSPILSFFITFPSVNVEFMAAKPQLEEGDYATSFSFYEKPNDTMSYKLNDDIRDKGTISCWIKYTGNSSSFNVFSLSDNNNHPDNAIRLDRIVEHPNRLRLTQYTEGIPISLDFVLPYDNLYHHYAITWTEAEGIKLYFDGDIVSSIPYRPIPLTSIFFNSGGKRLIANLRIDKREVSAGEIAEWAKMDRPFAVPNRVPVS